MIFSIQGCRWCETAKSYFASKGIRYQVINCDDTSGSQLDSIGGGRGFPVVLVGGTRIDGFDKEKIEAALESQKNPSTIKVFFARFFSLLS